jgi:hypothetical protein
MTECFGKREKLFRHPETDEPFIYMYMMPSVCYTGSSVKKKTWPCSIGGIPLSEELVYVYFEPFPSILDPSQGFWAIRIGRNELFLPLFLVFQIRT